MDKKFELHVPSFEELSYRQKILMQQTTMDYNKGHNIDFNGYHKETGCIDFPKTSWSKWYSFWINNKPKTYYAYIFNVSQNEYVGEVNLHYNVDKDWYEMGIIIENKYRGLGYSKSALKKLLEIAFYEYNANAVHNRFESSRIKAKKLHINCGFSVMKDSKGVIDLIINKDDYISKAAK